MTPADIDRVFGRGRLKMVTGEHVEVYREEALPGERRRYTKRFLRTAEGDFRHWTEREWRILARLVGHGIAPVPDVVQYDRGASNRPALVQTYDAGITVDHWATLLPVARGLRVLRHVFEDAAHWWSLARHCLLALDAIHALQVVHLDLKADNVCIPFAPAEFDPRLPGQVLRPQFAQIALIDFAFSLVAGDPLVTALPIGQQADYAYQSPRLLHALEAGRRGDLGPTRQLDWRCDIYSLAAMLQRCLPAAESAGADGWGVAGLAAAQGLIDRLLDAHAGPAEGERPHRQWIALCTETLAQAPMAAALDQGWRLAGMVPAADSPSPTPVTRIVWPVQALPPGEPVQAVPITPVVAITPPVHTNHATHAAKTADTAAANLPPDLTVPRPSRVGAGWRRFGATAALLIGGAAGMTWVAQAWLAREAADAARAVAAARTIEAPHPSIPGMSNESPAPSGAVAPPPTAPAASMPPRVAAVPAGTPPEGAASAVAAPTVAAAPMAMSPTPATAPASPASAAMPTVAVSPQPSAQTAPPAASAAPAAVEAVAAATSSAAVPTLSPAPTAATDTSRAPPVAAVARAARPQSGAAGGGKPAARTPADKRAAAAPRSSATRTAAHNAAPRQEAATPSMARLLAANRPRPAPTPAPTSDGARAATPSMARLLAASRSAPAASPPSAAPLPSNAVSAAPPAPAPTVNAAPAANPAPAREAAPASSPPAPSSQAPASQSARAPLPQDFTARGLALLADHVPQFAQRAERVVLRVLYAAARMDDDGHDADVLDAARALRLAPDAALTTAAGPGAEADADRASAAAAHAFWQARNPRQALELQLRAFGADPQDPTVAGDLAFYLLKQRPAQAEASRRMALYALALGGSPKPANGRLEDWTTLAIASALAGRERDARNAWFVTLALAPSLGPQCRAASAALAAHGEPLRAPTEAMLARIHDWGRSNESPFCRWPPNAVLGARAP